MDKKSFLRYWHQVRRLTIRLLDEFPADSFDYRPADEIMTVSQQFKHILLVEVFIREGFLTGEWENPENFETTMFEKDMLKDKMKIENNKTIQLLSEVADGQFIKIMKTPYGDISGEILLQVAIDEEIHHRGNLKGER